MMRSWLARHVFYPVQDRLCGRDSMSYWRRLEESQWWGDESLLRLQQRKLQALLKHAAAAPYYARCLEEARLDLQRAAGFDDLRRLPVLTKDAVRRHGQDLVTRGGLPMSQTSGSTGTPLHFRVDARRCRSDIAARLRAHQWFDIRPGDAAIYLWGARIEIEHQDRFKSLRDWLINEKLLNAFELSDRQLQRHADLFLRIRPRFMYSYASTLWRFARFVDEHRPEVRGTVGTAFATGEQMSPEWREAIVVDLGCRVAEEYGCREGGLIAHECPEGAYHVMAENVIVEVLDDDDRPVPMGTRGQLVITNLEAFGMPFIRYATGDIGALLDQRCRCGRSLPLMARPAGRAFDFLVAEDGTRVTGVSLSRDLKEIRGIEHYRVVQERLRVVRILVVPGAGYDRKADEARIREFVRQRLGSGMSVQLEYVDRLPAHASGKHRYVLNAIS